MKEISDNGLRIFFAAVFPPVAGTILTALGAIVIKDYGWTLFVLLPVFLGLSSTLIYSANGDKTYWKCLLIALLTIPVIGFAIMLFAIEGLICLAMALPLAVPLIAIGVAIGWVIKSRLRDSRAGLGLQVLLFVAMPFLMGFEASDRSTPTVHQVVTTVEVDAPIEIVWKNVVEFSEIDAAPEGVLRLGFAYPINARIDGTGVGAVRYCNFNTGPFVEPITAWQEPHLLAFDVVEQPAPMIELTPYKHLHAAHLEYLRSQRGQFRLSRNGDKTTVEGTTFYTHDIAPDAYWKQFSDRIIQQIHLRVLNHIKSVAESEAGRR